MNCAFTDTSIPRAYYAGHKLLRTKKIRKMSTKWIQNENSWKRNIKCTNRNNILTPSKTHTKQLMAIKT